MTRSLFAACVLTFACAGAACAQSTVAPIESGAHYTKAQVKQLARAARAPEQFRALASYYSELHNTYLQKAKAEKIEWEQRSQNVSGNSAKYPRPSDSSRNLYEYYMSKVSETAGLMDLYSRRASPDSAGMFR